MVYGPGSVVHGCNSDANNLNILLLGSSIQRALELSHTASRAVNGHNTGRVIAYGEDSVYNSAVSKLTGAFISDVSSKQSSFSVLRSDHGYFVRYLSCIGDR